MRSLPTRVVNIRVKSNQSAEHSVAGVSRVFFAFIAASFFGLGGMYVFSINERAVYGYDMRTLEKEVAVLKKDNAKLRLDEARAKSLTTVEVGSTELRMERAEPSLELTLERPDTVAFR